MLMSTCQRTFLFLFILFFSFLLINNVEALDTKGNSSVIILSTMMENNETYKLYTTEKSQFKMLYERLEIVVFNPHGGIVNISEDYVYTNYRVITEEKFTHTFSYSFIPDRTLINLLTVKVNTDIFYYRFISIIKFDIGETEGLFSTDNFILANSLDEIKWILLWYLSTGGIFALFIAYLLVSWYVENHIVGVG